MALLMRQRQTLVRLLSQNVTFISQRSSSSKNIKNANATASKEVTDLVVKKQRGSGPKASKQQVRKIKLLHKENKELFGALHETKQEKVKRTRKELKPIKQQKIGLAKASKPALLPEPKSSELEYSGVMDQEVSSTLNLLAADETPRKRRNAYAASYLNPKSLPKASSVRLEHAGVSINKTRVNSQDAVADKEDTLNGKVPSAKKVAVRAHKGAEIEWAMKNAPTKIKLIELSSSAVSTSTRNGDLVADNKCQVLDDESGHSPTLSRTESLPIEDVDVGAPPQPSSSFNISANPRSSTQTPATSSELDSLPTVEQLINSFYETDNNGQLLPDSVKATARKMNLSATKSYSSSGSTEENLGYPHQFKRSGGAGRDFNEQPHKKQQKTDDLQGNGAALMEASTSSSPTLFLPYYNPDRNQNYYSTDTTDHDGGTDVIKSAESTIITSFPYPFTFSSKSGQAEEASQTPPALLNAVDQQSPPQKSLKLPSVSKILNATMPEEQAQALKRWEQRMIAQMGEQGFRQYKESILSNGKLLHSNIELYLRGTPAEEITIAQTNQGHWNSLNAVLASVDHVHVLESHVVHPKLQYCGVIDCVAEFRNRLVLIDWKTSQKPKPFVSMTYDTPLQIAAYIGAINYDERYSLKINDGLIVIAYEDGSSCQTFLLSSMEVDKYWKLWLKRLQLFRKMNTPL